jgi:hypothetical protein
VCQSRQAPKRYFPGPDLAGALCRFQAEQVANLATEWQHKFPHQKIYLAGHSRGGAICIEAARILRSAGTKIECLALFDAVQMELWFDASFVPNNVKYACHAVRDRSVGSRSSWGNCGLMIEPPGVLQAHSFRTTHAGMGGTPGTGDNPKRRVVDKNQRYNVATSQEIAHAPDYIAALTPEDEKRGSQRVRVWMWSKMTEHSML